MRYHSGEIPAIGDRVLALESLMGYPEPGTEGIVQQIGDGGIAVLFNNLANEQTSLGETHVTWAMPSDYLELITLPPKDVSTYAELFLKEKSYLVNTNKVYEVSLLPGNDAIATLLRARDEASRVMFSQAIANLKHTQDIWMEKTKSIISMPEISRADLQEGVRVCKIEGVLSWFLPFIYAPIIITQAGESRELLQDIKDGLKREVILHIHVPNNSNPSIFLVEHDLVTRFYHYHSLDIRDCLGQYNVPKLIMSATVAKQIRNDVQRLFETINTNSLGMFRHFKYLTKDLWESSTAIDTPGWAVSYTIGQLVKIIGEPPGFPIDCINSVGTVTSVRHQIRVTFAFIHPSFTPLTYNHRRCTTFGFMPSNLEIMPKDTQLTKKAGVNQGGVV